MKRVIAILDLPPRRAVPTVRESVEAAAERWNVELHWIRRPLQPCHPFWQRCSSVVMLQSGSVRRMSCKSTTTWLFAATAHRRSSWLSLASSQWLPNGSAPKPNRQRRVAKDSARRDLGQTLVDSIPRRLGCIPTVDCICTTPKRLLACSSESFQYLIVTFGANDQATDESLIINQLWNDHAETITFLPPDFNVSMLQTPEWATNPVMQSFVYHFIGPSKPHLDRCHWQRSNPPELPFS